MYAVTEKFLGRHIRGIRHQEDMAPEVAQRLKEIGVNPATVKLKLKVGG